MKWTDRDNVPVAILVALGLAAIIVMAICGRWHAGAI
jgi:hypothetical protein